MTQNSINLSGTADGVPVANSTGSALQAVTLGDGEILVGVTGGAPVATTLTEGANVTITNGPNSIEIAAAGGGAGVNVLAITEDGIYTTPANLLCAVIEAVGGGGAGGGASRSSPGVAVGSAGGAGAYGRVILTAAQLGPSPALQVGQGGVGSNTAGADGSDTTIVCAAGTFELPGGKGGPSAEDTDICVSDPALYSDAPIGAWNVSARGQGGGGGYIERTDGVGIQGCSLPGGSTLWGGGAPHTEMWRFSTTNEAQAGIDALSPGGGGSGGMLQNASGTVNVNGGSGANGLILITEYFAP